MEELLNALNENSGVLSLLFSLVVSVATVFYVILTGRLVAETKKMRRAQTEPHVAAKVEASDSAIHIILLVIENVGVGPAYNVRLQIAPDFQMEHNERLSEIGLFKHGISYLAPGQKIKLFLTSLLGKIEEIQKPNNKYQFTITASYKSTAGVKYSNTYPIDFLHFVGLSRIGKPAMQSMADHLDKISKSIENIQTGWSTIKVNTYGHEDRNRQEEESEQRLKEWEEQNRKRSSSQKQLDGDKAVS